MPTCLACGHTADHDYGPGRTCAHSTCMCRSLVGLETLHPSLTGASITDPGLVRLLVTRYKTRVDIASIQAELLAQMARLATLEVDVLTRVRALSTDLSAIEAALAPDKHVPDATRGIRLTDDGAASE